MESNGLSYNLSNLLNSNDDGNYTGTWVKM